MLSRPQGLPTHLPCSKIVRSSASAIVRSGRLAQLTSSASNGEGIGNARLPHRVRYERNFMPRGVYFLPGFEAAASAVPVRPSGSAGEVRSIGMVLCVVTPMPKRGTVCGP
jgi:hypothetical protein